jgi:hypothetical protein
MKAAHLFGKVYGWTLHETLDLTYTQMNIFMRLIEQDNVREQMQINQAKRRR